MSKMNDAEPLLLDAQHTARLLGICRAGVYRGVANGRIPAPVRIGRRTLWRRAELLAWVNAGCPPVSRWTWTPGDQRAT